MVSHIQVAFHALSKTNLSMLGIWVKELLKDLHLDQWQGCIFLQSLSRFSLQCHMCQHTEIHLILGDSFKKFLFLRSK